MQEERRRHPRVKLRWPVKLGISKGQLSEFWAVTVDLNGRIEDISASGAFICCEEPLGLNEKFNVVLNDDLEPDRKLPVNAKVIRSNVHCLDDEIMSHGMGVVFTNLTAEDQQFISDLVSRLL